MNRAQELLLDVPALGTIIYTDEDTGREMIYGNWDEINFGSWGGDVWYAPRYTQDWKYLCTLPCVRVFMRSNEHLARS